MSKFLSSIAAIAAIGLCAPALAAPTNDPPPPAGDPHGGGSPHGNFSSAGSYAGARGPVGPRGGPMDLHGRDFGHLTADLHAHWDHGQWLHTWHNGMYGWWWFLDDYWYFYNEPIYPFPTYIAPYYYEDEEAPEPGPGNGYWYHCDNPPGYYPYVKACPGGWQVVPAIPPDAH